MALVDLHTHTNFSDGRLSPAGLFEKASLRGLAAIAITDHDSVAALGIAGVSAERFGVELVSGVELSANTSSGSAHILGYLIDPTNSALRDHLAYYRQARIERARAMVDRLEQLGAPVSWERVLAIAGAGTIGRPHIARALIEARRVATLWQAFEQYLGNSAPAYVAKPPVSVATIIGLIHGAGGVAVLAHPGTSFTEQDVRGFVDAGLDGVEAIHPSHDRRMVEGWEDIATRLGLLTTGGSDYHGYRPQEEDAFGKLGVALERLEELRQRALQHAL